MMSSNEVAGQDTRSSTKHRAYRRNWYGFLVAGSLLLTVHQAHASPPGKSGLSTETHRDGIGRQAGETLALKLLLHAIMDLLDVSQARSLSTSHSLDGDAISVRDSYQFSGVRTDLTGQEIQDGIDDCNESLGLINNDPAAELDITPSLLAELESTLIALKGDLKDAL